MLANIFHKIAAETQGEVKEYRRRPSSAGPERCIRSMVYHASKVAPEPFPGRAMMIFDDSSWHEELTNDWIRKSAFRLHSEHMRVDTAVGPGEIDGIITDLLGVDRLYEHKAINHFSFQRIWGGEWPLDYFTQATIYLDGLIKIQPEMSEMLLLVKNKNTAQYMDFIAKYDAAQDTLTVIEAERSDGETMKVGLVMPNIVKNAVEKFDQVDSHVFAGTLPERPYEYGTEFPCGYCRWGKVCWETYEEEFGELKTDAELPEEIADKIRFYQEIGGQKKDMTDQYEEISKEIKLTLQSAGVRKGRAGEYLIERRLQKSVSYDPAKIPEKIRIEAKKETPYERLYIKKLEVK